MKQNPIIRGTIVLTLTGLTTRFIGFFFRIFLSHAFGEEQVGLYQLIFPIYALCFSFTSAGIETALSRCVAQKLSQNKRNEANILLYYALLISLTLSIFFACFLQKYATFFTYVVLKDVRCEPLVRAMSYALPFAAFHSCMVGFYLGQKQTKLPAISQFLEQICRVGAVYIMYQIFINSHKMPTIRLAVFGIVIGEVITCLYCFHVFRKSKPTKFSFSLLKQHTHLRKELSAMAIPLTSNRVLMNMLQSIETISIPLGLQAYGYNNSNALVTYGVFTGMALPCIFFPTALTSSVSTMLLPTVAEIQSSPSSDKLKRLIRKVFLFGIGLGSFCCIFFLLTGSYIGNVLFDSSLAGHYIQTLAWICPFMYVNTTLVSILNGLGKANLSLGIHLCSLAIRIFGVWFGVPRWGMEGYLWGLLASQTLTTVLCGRFLYVYAQKK